MILYKTNINNEDNMVILKGKISHFRKMKMKKTGNLFKPR